MWNGEARCPYLYYRYLFFFPSVPKHNVVGFSQEPLEDEMDLSRDYPLIHLNLNQVINARWQVKSSFSV